MYLCVYIRGVMEFLINKCCPHPHTDEMTISIQLTPEIILLTALLAGPTFGLTFFPECWHLVRSCIMGTGESSGMERYPCVTRYA